MHVVVADVPYFELVLLGKMIWRLFGELLKERFEFGCCSRARDARFELDKRAISDRLRSRRVEREIRVAVHPGKAWRQHAQNGVGLMNHLNRLTNDGRVTIEVALPELVAQDNHWLRLLAIRSIRRKKITAQHSRQTKELESGAGQIDSPHIFRNIAAGDGQVPFVYAHHVFHGARLSQLPYLRTRKAVPVVSSGLVQEGDAANPIGSGIGPGIHQDSVNNAED